MDKIKGKKSKKNKQKSTGKISKNPHIKYKNKKSKTHSGRKSVSHTSASARGTKKENSRGKNNDQKNERPAYKTPEQLIEERGDFNAEVKKEIAHIRTSLSKTAIESELKKGRRDLRALTVVTVDSEETKDVDDAISIEKAEDGTFVLGVHIADVAQYVKEGTALDAEAYERGTSVYLVDKVLPMLPRKLSNGICSLNVGEDRFAMSVIMTLDKYGQIIKYEIFESIINVTYKITYEQIYALMEGDTDMYKKSDLENEFSEHIEDLYLMRELAALRHAVRYKRGAIDFEFPETHVTTDEEGAPVSIEAYRDTFANNIIEEFMLAANETVAEHFSRIKAPFLYRVHGLPESDKIYALSSVIRSMGFTLRGNGSISSGIIQDLLKTVKGKAAEPAVSMLTLRAMQKAEYSPKNEGHFGLAAEDYTHFTSPIRRYPDLFVHRVIKDILHGKMSSERAAELRQFAEYAAVHCSETEREAENAERTYTDMLIAMYMEKHIGDVFEGIICNITSFGIFVRLDNSAEGLVFYNSMPEYMIFDDKKMIAIGEHSKSKLAIGDRVRVKVANCNIKMGQIEFHFTK